MLAETRAELDEFQQSSKELEEELEAELVRTEKAQKDLVVKASKAESERDEWKVRYCILSSAPIPSYGSRGHPHTDQIHVSSNATQYNRRISSARARPTTAGTPEGQDTTARARNG